MPPCVLQGCKNVARCVTWPEIVKGVLNQGFVLLGRAAFSVCLLCFELYVVF